MLYTGGRLIQATLQGREKPWAALVTGMSPVIGNPAYPIQSVYSSIGRHHDLARFIIDDAFSLFGQKVPIWGGRDTLTEHVCNRLPIALLPGSRSVGTEPGLTTAPPEPSP